MKKIALFISSVLLLAVYSAVDMADAQRWWVRGRQAVDSVFVGRLKQGDLGWQIGMDMVPNLAGTDVHRAVWNDASNGYCMDPGETQWRPAIRMSTFPPAYSTTGPAYGPTSMRIAPSDPNRVYMLWSPYTQWIGGSTTNTMVFRSDDGCRTWAATKFPWTGNEQCCAHGNPASERMAVDPHNKDVIYVGHVTQGVERSLDGGETWAQVVDAGTGNPIPATSYGGAFMASSGVAIYGGATATCPTVGGTCGRDIYLPVYGKGIWASFDGGATFNQISGASPTMTMSSYSNSGTNRIVIATVVDFQDNQDSTSVVGSTLGAFTHYCTIAGSSSWKARVYYAHATAQLSGESIVANWANGNSGSNQYMEVFSISGADLSGGVAAAFDGACSTGSSSGGSKTTTNANNLVWTIQLSLQTTPTSTWACFSTSPNCLGTAPNGTWWGEYKVVSSTGTFNQTAAAQNRGGYFAAVKNGGGIAVENVRSQSGLDPATTPDRIVSGKLTCDGTYFVTHRPSADGFVNVGPYRAYRYDGTPFSWTQNATLTMTNIRYVIPKDCATNPDGLLLASQRFSSGLAEGMWQLADKANWGSAGSYNGFAPMGLNSATTVADVPLFLTPPTGYPYSGWQNSLDLGDCMFNPVNGQLECSTGFAYYKATVPYPGAYFEWEVMASPIEAVVGQLFASVPGYWDWFGGQDVGWFAGLNTITQPANTNSGSDPRPFPRIPIGGLCGSRSLDYMGTDPKNIWLYCSQSSGLVLIGWADDGGNNQLSFRAIGFPTTTDETASFKPSIFPIYGAPAGRGSQVAVNACDATNLLLANPNTTASGNAPPLWQTKTAKGAATVISSTMVGANPSAVTSFTVNSITGTQPQVGDIIYPVNGAGVIFGGLANPVTIASISGPGAPATYTLSQGATFSGTVGPVNWHTENSNYYWTNIQANLSGVPTSGANLGWGVSASYSGPYSVVSDKVQCDTFYAYNTVSDDLYRTTDKGDTWSIIANNIGATYGFAFGNNSTLVVNPEVAGEMYMIGGTFATSPTLKITGAHTGSSATITQCTIMNFSVSAAYGKGRNPGDPPVIWFLGNNSSGVRVTARSDDGCASIAFEETRNQPTGDEYPEGAGTMGASMNVFGRWYIGLTAGAGYTCGQVIVPGGPTTC